MTNYDALIVMSTEERVWNYNPKMSDHCGRGFSYLVAKEDFHECECVKLSFIFGGCRFLRNHRMQLHVTIKVHPPLESPLEIV
jgi:hypothetical protein